MDRRPEARTFFMRRLAAAVIAIAGVVAVVVLFWAMGDDASNVAIVTTRPAPEGSGLPASTTAPAQIRVLLVGDSESGALSASLGEVLAPTGVELVTDSKISSGLVRPDFFDWPAHLRDTVPDAGAQIVVAMFGGNDGQRFLDMPGKPVDSTEWRAEYAERVADVMELLSDGGRTLVWVGVPQARTQSLNSALAVQNEVVRDEVAKHPDVVFVDAWARFSGIDGSYAPFIADPRTGEYVPVRNREDGFHLNTTGAQILAAYVREAIAADLAARGSPLTSVDATPSTFDPADGGFYVVSEGDSLSKIAADTGATVAAIVAANGWADDSQVIQPGMKIALPAKT